MYCSSFKQLLTVRTTMPASVDLRPKQRALRLPSTGTQMSPLSGVKDVWRLELFFKSEEQLRHNLVPFLKQHDIHRVNITNKTKEDKLLQQVRLLKDSLPAVEICCHYSLKHHPAKQGAANLQQFLSELQSIAGSSCLLVSGGGKKPKFDTVQALQQLRQCALPLHFSSSKKPRLQAGQNSEAREIHDGTWPPVHVAFNPYLPGAAQDEERKRLQQKLRTGAVAGVYLQVGSDVQALNSGLSFCRAAMQQHCPASATLHGSVFIPSKRLLAQMRFRPWNGVFLSETYLASVDNAVEITKQMLDVYAAHHVLPLIETAVTNESDLRMLTELLEHYKQACVQSGNSNGHVAELVLPS